MAACVGGATLASIASDAIFLRSFSFGAMSRFVGVSAIIRVAASLVYAWASARERRFDLDGALIYGSAASFGAALALERAGHPWASYAACVLLTVFAPLLPLIAFGRITDGLAARQAKRVLPLLAGAASVGTILAALIGSAAAKALGTPAIVAIGAAVLSLTPQALPPLAKKRSEPAHAVTFLDTLGETLRDVGKVPAVRVVVALGFFGATLTALSEYAFKSALKHAYDPAELPFLLSAFGVVSNVVVLLLQGAFTGRLVGRLGVGRTLQLGPLLLGGVAIFAPFLPPVAGATTVRLTETVAKYGAGNSVADILLVPLPRLVRTRAKVSVKGAASPLGAVLAGLTLSLFGEAGPAPWVQFALIVGFSIALLLMVRGAPEAYAHALSSALAEGRQFEVSAEAAMVFRQAVRRELSEQIQRENEGGAERTLHIMNASTFDIEDLEPALHAPSPRLRRAAIETAARLEVAPSSLLERLRSDPDLEVERAALEFARTGGVLASPTRREAARRHAEEAPEGSDGRWDLWAEALMHQALAARESDRNVYDATLKKLRTSAKNASGSERACALRALGLVGDPRAAREVQGALGSTEPAAFREAAKAAVLLDLPGIIPNLIARLVSGPHPQIAARALGLMGPRAVHELTLALPVVRGEGSILPTAVSDGFRLTGSVRAARALARIGEDAALSVLPRFGALGHRARCAVAQCFGASQIRVRETERDHVEEAISAVTRYAESLMAHRQIHHGLLQSELEFRLRECVSAIYDLASTLTPSPAFERAKVAVFTQHQRDNALELLETVVGGKAGLRSSSLVAAIVTGSVDPERPRAPLEGWLLKLRDFDDNKLAVNDSMKSVLDRVLLLKDVDLFTGLSSEDLYSVAEIAQLSEASPESPVVVQGEASEDLYVVLTGRLRVVRDGQTVAHLTEKQAFGELGVLDGAPRAATVIAEEPTRLLRIPRAMLESLLDESPTLAKGIIVTLLRYVREGTKR